MSYDLEVRADARYFAFGAAVYAWPRYASSRCPASRGPARTRSSSDRADAGIHLNIDLAHDADGEGSPRLGRHPVTLAALTVPYAFLGKTAPVALEMALRIADESLGLVGVRPARRLRPDPRDRGRSARSWRRKATTTSWSVRSRPRLRSARCRPEMGHPPCRRRPGLFVASRRGRRLLFHLAPREDFDSPVAVCWRVAPSAKASAGLPPPRRGRRAAARPSAGQASGRFLQWPRHGQSRRRAGVSRHPALPPGRRAQRRRRRAPPGLRRAGGQLLEARLQVPAPALARERGGRRGPDAGLLRARLREGLLRPLRSRARAFPDLPAHVPRRPRGATRAWRRGASSAGAPRRRSPSTSRRGGRAAPAAGGARTRTWRSTSTASGCAASSGWPWTRCAAGPRRGAGGVAFEVFRRYDLEDAEGPTGRPTRSWAARWACPPRR